MTESFDELLKLAEQQLAIERAESEASRVRDDALREEATLRKNEALALLTLTRQDADTVSLALQTEGLKSDLQAVTVETEREAWRTQIGRPRKPGSYISPRKIKRSHDNAMRIREEGKFPVWDLNTMWTTIEGGDDDPTYITRHDYLGMRGVLYSSSRYENGLVVVEANKGLESASTSRLHSIRAGLAMIVARNNLTLQ